MDTPKTILNTGLITEIEEKSNVFSEYEIKNDESSLDEFRDRYILLKPEMAREVSTTGKYIVGKPGETGFWI